MSAIAICTIAVVRVLAARPELPCALAAKSVRRRMQLAPHLPRHPEQQQAAREQQPDDREQLHGDQRERDPAQHRQHDADHDDLALLLARQPARRHPDHDRVVAGEHEVDHDHRGEGVELREQIVHQLRSTGRCRRRARRKSWVSGFLVKQARFGTRRADGNYGRSCAGTRRMTPGRQPLPVLTGGADGARTHDLDGANVALSQTELRPRSLVARLADGWWSRWGSNPRPLECDSSALPAELRPRHGSLYGERGLGCQGLAPAARGGRQIHRPDVRGHRRRLRRGAGGPPVSCYIPPRHEMSAAGRPGWFRLAQGPPMNPVHWLLDQILWLYIWVVIASVVLSWLVAFNVINTRNSFVHQVGEFLYRATEPVLRPIRSVIAEPRRHRHLAGRAAPAAATSCSACSGSCSPERLIRSAGLELAVRRRRRRARDAQGDAAGGAKRGAGHRGRCARPGAPRGAGRGAAELTARRMRP